MWGEGETTPGRKRPARVPELKGVFGAGASNVVSPPQPSASSVSTRAVAANENSAEAEERQARALKAHGLWTNQPRDPGELPATQPRIGLPRAVIGSDVDLSTPVNPASIPLPEVGAPLPPVEPRLLDRSAGAQGAQLRAANQNAVIEPPSEPPAAVAAPAELPTPAPVSLAPEVEPEPVAVVTAPVQASEPPAAKVASVKPAPAAPQKHVAPRVEQAPKRDLRLAIALVVLAVLAALLVGGAWAGFWHLPFVPAHKAAATRETRTAPSLRAPTETAVVKPSAPPVQPAAAPVALAQAEAPSAQPEAEPAPEAKAEPAPEAEEPPPAAEPEAPKLAASPNASVQDQLRDARKQLKAKHPESAEALLRQLLDRTPEDLQIMSMLTQSLLAQRNGQEALSFAQQLVRKRPKRAVSRILLGDALQLTGDKSGAVAEWREALQLDTSSREARRRLVQAGEELVTTPVAAEQPVATE